MELSDAICESYAALEGEYGRGVDTAVRSSATAEDLPDASFAGQQETYLNIRGYGTQLCCPPATHPCITDSSDRH